MNPTDLLLNRPWSGPLREDWPPEKHNRRVALQTGSIAVLLFRARTKHFAIRLSALDFCSPAPSFHSIPFRSSPVFLGLGNVGGEFVLCIAAATLLESVQAEPGPVCIGISSQHTRYALIVAGIKGLHRVFPSELTPVSGEGSCTNANFQATGLPVALIDEACLTATMGRLCSRSGDAA